jgi:hypothetical protein
MKLEVIRGKGDKDGGVIYAPLLSTTEAMVARGRLAIEEGTRKSRVQIRVPYMAGLAPGQIIETHDELNNLWRGKIRAVRLSIQGANSSALLEVERHEP